MKINAFILTFLLAVFATPLFAADSNMRPNTPDLRRQLDPAKKQSALIPVTFSSDSSLAEAPTCPQIASTAEGITGFPTSTSVSLTRVDGTTFYDERLQAITNSSTPAYYTCYYQINYYKTRLTASELDGAAKLLRLSTTSARACPTDIFVGANNLNCQLGVGSQIYSGVNATNVPNTSVCIDDSQVRNIFQTRALCATNLYPYPEWPKLALAPIENAGWGNISVYMYGHSVNIPRCSDPAPLVIRIPSTSNSLPFYVQYNFSLRGALLASSSTACPSMPITDYWSFPVNSRIGINLQGVPVTIVRGKRNIIVITPNLANLSRMSHGSTNYTCYDGDRLEKHICPPNDEDAMQINYGSISVTSTATYP